MSVTNFPNGISSFGIPQIGNGIPAVPGKVIFVNYSDGNDGVALKSNSIKRAYKTLAKAYDMATTNKDDVIALVGAGSHVLTEMLTVAKNRVHFVGLDGASRNYGQGAKISLGITGVATNLGTVLNTGTRNSFTNIKFINEDTVAQGLYTFLDAGEYMFMDRCEIYKPTFLTTTGASELVANGDSAIYRKCFIGSDATAITGAIIRPNVTVTAAIAAAGKSCVDNTFEDCIFMRSSGHVNNKFIHGASVTDVVRMLLFDRCMFISAKNSLALPAVCMSFGGTLTSGQAICRDCTSVGNTAISAATGVYVTGFQPNSATTTTTCGLAVTF